MTHNTHDNLDNGDADGALGWIQSLMTYAGCNMKQKVQQKSNQPRWWDNEFEEYKENTTACTYSGEQGQIVIQIDIKSLGKTLDSSVQ